MCLGHPQKEEKQLFVRSFGAKSKAYQRKELSILLSLYHKDPILPETLPLQEQLLDKRNPRIEDVSRFFFSALGFNDSWTPVAKMSDGFP